MLHNSPLPEAGALPCRRDRPPADAGGQAGVSLIEVIVVVAVMVILAAATVPSLLASLDRARVSTAMESLDAITDAMTTMRRDNQDWPGRLSHMSSPITTNDRNVCWGPTNTYSQGKVGNWGGPYLDRTVPATGLPIGIGVVLDSVYRSAVSGNDGLLTLEIRSVSLDDARALNRRVDADGDVAGSATGTVRWGATDAEGRVTLFYYRPIRGC